MGQSLVYDTQKFNSILQKAPRLFKLIKGAAVILDYNGVIIFSNKAPLSVSQGVPELKESRPLTIIHQPLAQGYTPLQDGTT